MEVRGQQTEEGRRRRILRMVSDWRDSLKVRLPVTLLAFPWGSKSKCKPFFARVTDDHVVYFCRSMARGTWAVGASTSLMTVSWALRTSQAAVYAEVTAAFPRLSFCMSLLRYKTPNPHTFSCLSTSFPSSVKSCWSERRIELALRMCWHQNIWTWWWWCDTAQIFFDVRSPIGLKV